MRDGRSGCVATGGPVDEKPDKFNEPNIVFTRGEKSKQ